MSKREWLFGIGVGILIGASLMQLGVTSQNTLPPTTQEPVPSSSDPINEEQVQQWLKENGYAFVKQSDWDAQVARIKELEERPSAPASTTVYINPGLSVEGMESLFVKSGLLPQDNQFAEMIGEQGLSRKVRSGSYKFEGNQTEESIIQEITISK